MQFKCRAEPSLPPEDMSDAELMVYITRLQYAGDDCRAQLAEVKNTLELQEGVIIADTITRAVKPAKKWWRR